MRNLFSFLSPSLKVPEAFRQTVAITNILSFILSLLTYVLFFILFGMFGWTPTLKYIILVGVIFFTLIFTNRKFYNAGRLLFCLMPVWMILFVSLYGKYIQDGQSYIIYFDSRYLLLATTILPATVFKLSERNKIMVCFASTFICLLFFDPIHNAFGLGYYQMGFTVPSYYYINYITLISYLVLLFGIFTLKSFTEKAETKLQVLIDEKDSINKQLVNKNDQLIQLFSEIESQNEEMQQQQEELSAGRDKLEEASELIKSQKDKLSLYTIQLEALIEEKNKNLYLANEELVKHNNELRQFSYTVSHNLRGPVARLLGLSQLLNKTVPEEEKTKILGYINQSTLDLDGVLKDLSIIIDIRNKLYNIREKILIVDEWEKVINILRENISPEFSIQTDFSKATYLFAIRPMLHSILYNLLSNAIKYRSPDRPLKIELTSSQGPQQEVILVMRDNGLGIDLVRQRENIFKLYKRFHAHVMGKGLGLFIVKTQLEIMDGKIEIESQINKGTLFRITLPKPFEVEKQVFLENQAAQLYYDGELNTTIISWKKNITSAEYRNVFESMLQNLRTYSSPAWIADLREQGKVEEDDQVWFVSTVLPEATRNGLKRIVTVGFKDPIRRTYLERMKTKTNEYGLEFFICDSLEEAREKVKEFLFSK